MDVTQSAPIGNGNLAANVFVDASDGTLTLLAARSDAISDHGQFLKVTWAKIGELIVDGTPVDLRTGMLTHDPWTGQVVVRIGGGKAAVNVTAYADTRADVIRVRVQADASQAIKGTARLVAVRTAQSVNSSSVAGWFGATICNDTRPLVLDTALDTGSFAGFVGSAVFHRNSNASTFSFIRDTLLQQHVPIPGDIDELDDISSRVTAAAITASGASAANATAVAFVGEGEANIDVVTLSEQLPEGSPDPVVSKLEAAVQSNACSLHAGACGAAMQQSEGDWSGWWARSSLSVSSPSDAATAEAVTDQYTRARFLSLSGGRRAYLPTKFNGQWWTVPVDGHGPDYRQWGADYWGQNTRQQMQAALASKDHDVVAQALGMYQRAVPFALAREAAWFRNATTPAQGFYFPETMTHFGMYNQGGFGWGCGWSPPGGSRFRYYTSNPYVRFYVSSTLEFAMIALDLDSASEAGYGWAAGLASNITQHYFNAYPLEGGQLDLFPAQAMETWQCKDPTDRSNCVTNPVTAVSGLTAVLSRLASLSRAEPALRQQDWASLLEAVPYLPNGTKNGHPVFLPGDKTPPHTSNSENVATQVVHPYRLTTAAKAAAAGPSSFAGRSVALANNTFDARPFPCNDGWCWDVVVAALLNRTEDFATMTAQRATAQPAFAGGWPGFSAHNQDYEPSLDQLATMRQALHDALIQPLDDADQRIAVFASWPDYRWDVSFSLVGPKATTVTAECTNGTVTAIQVDPPTRAGDVLVAGCGGNMRPATDWQ